MKLIEDLGVVRYLTTSRRSERVGIYKWAANIMVNRARIYLGVFTAPEEAAKVYDKYVRQNNLQHPCNFTL
jgi:hypothetical protein